MSAVSLCFSYRNRKYVMAVLVSILCSIALASCSVVAPDKPAAEEVSFKTVDEIRASGVIRIGLSIDECPFGHQESTGEFLGYDVDYAHRLAKDLGVEVQYVPVADTNSRITLLQENKADLVLANLTVTPERARKVDFTHPYMKATLALVTPDKAPVTEMSALQAKKVAVLEGSTAESYLAETHPGVKLMHYSHRNDAVEAMTGHRVDAWLTDNVEALAFSSKFTGNSVTISNLGTVKTIAGAVAKGNVSLLNWINGNLTKLEREQFFHKNFDKNLRRFFGPDVVPTDIIVEGS